MAFGVVLNTKTGLGVQAGILLPFVLSSITGITLGTLTIMLHIVLISLQAIITRRINMKVILQLPVTLLFGQAIDLLNGLLDFEATNIFISGLVLCLAMIFAAFGMMLSVSMKIVPVALDGFVKTVSEHFAFAIGRVKIFFDSSLVMVSIVLSLIFAGEIIGVGVGTVVAAFLIGRIGAFFLPWINRLYKVEASPLGYDKRDKSPKDN